MFIVRPKQLVLGDSNLKEIAPEYNASTAYTKGDTVTWVFYNQTTKLYMAYGFVAKKDIEAANWRSHPRYTMDYYKTISDPNYTTDYWHVVKNMGKAYWSSTATYSKEPSVLSNYVVDDDHNVYLSIVDSNTDSKPSANCTGESAKWRKLWISNSYAVFDDTGLTKTMGAADTNESGEAINRIKVTIDSSKADTCCGFNTKARTVNWKLFSTLDMASSSYNTPALGETSFILSPKTEDAFGDSQDFSRADLYTATNISVGATALYGTPFPGYRNVLQTSSYSGSHSIKRSFSPLPGRKYLVSVNLYDSYFSHVSYKCQYVMIRTGGGLQTKECVYDLQNKTVFTTGVGGTLSSNISSIEQQCLITLPVEGVTGNDGTVELVLLKSNTSDVSLPDNISSSFNVWLFAFSVQEDNITDLIATSGQVVTIQNNSIFDVPMRGTITSYTCPNLTVNITDKSTSTVQYNDWTLIINSEHSAGEITLSNNNTSTWTSYFFDQTDYGDSCFYFKFPLLFKSVLQISIDHVDSAECGRLFVGKAEPLGITQKDVSYTIENYSRIITDDFGYTYISEGAYKIKIPLKVYLLNTAITAATRALTSLRASPAAFIGDNSELYDSSYEILYVYGLVKDFEMVIPGESATLYSLEIESLV